MIENLTATDGTKDVDSLGRWLSRSVSCVLPNGSSTTLDWAVRRPTEPPQRAAAFCVRVCLITPSLLCVHYNVCTVQAWQKAGYDTGSVVKPMPAVAEMMSMARERLQMKH